jgi:hypothetical protein
MIVGSERKLMLYYPQSEHFILKAHLIEDRPVLGFIRLPWRCQKVSPHPKKWHEIYRQGVHWLSVGPNFKGSPPRLRNGDYVYSISLSSRTYGWNGNMVTKEGKPRNYEMYVELKVAYPRRFIELYDNHQDPAWEVWERYKQISEYVVKLGEGAEEKMRPWLEKHATMLSQQYGIQVMNPVWFFPGEASGPKNTPQADETAQIIERGKRGLEITYRLKEYEEQLKRELEKEKRAFDREEQEKKNRFAQREQLYKRRNEEQIRFLASIVDNLIQLNNSRMNDRLDYNNPMHLILRDSLQLLTYLNDDPSAVPKEQEDIVDSPPLDGQPTSSEGNNGPDTTVHPIFSSNAAPNDAKQTEK